MLSLENLIKILTNINLLAIFDNQFFFNLTRDFKKYYLTTKLTNFYSMVKMCLIMLDF